MTISHKEYEMLLHDLKRIGKAVEIITEEENQDKRKIIADLLRAELDRLYEDVQEAKSRNEINK
jgi:hypothetical protein